MIRFAGQLDGPKAVGAAYRGYPCDGVITTLFGVVDALHPSGHGGTDIGAPVGTPILAPASGFVAEPMIANDAIYGNFLVVDHVDGWRTLYAHMVAPAVPGAGQFVNTGDLLGYVGSSGFSTGPHLHWTLALGSDPRWLGDHLRDALDYLGGKNMDGDLERLAELVLAGGEYSDLSERRSRVRAALDAAPPAASLADRIVSAQRIIFGDVDWSDPAQAQAMQALSDDIIARGGLLKVLESLTERLDNASDV